MIDISEMTPRDLDSIKDILCSEFDDFWNFNVLKKDFENPHTKYLVAKSNDCVVGFAGMLDTIDQFEITNIVVKKNERNCGIGNLLLKNLISIAKNSHREKIYLEVNENNIYAIKLYEKYGFKKVGLRKNYYNHNCDAFIMILNIK